MDESPPKVLLWADTCGEWPSLTKGGCRFLPKCRAWFLEMVRIWTREGLRLEIGVKLPTLTEDLKEYAVFGIAPSVIAKCNFREATDVPTGLVRPQSLKVKQIEIVPSTVRSYAIGKFCKKQT